MLCIPSTGSRQKLIEKIKAYNRYKRAQRDDEKRGLNAGLLTPDDRLDKPIEEKILGTPESRLYMHSYSEYLRHYELQHHTTENALNLRYWRTIRYSEALADSVSQFSKQFIRRYSCSRARTRWMRTRTWWIWMKQRWARQRWTPGPASNAAWTFNFWLFTSADRLRQFVHLGKATKIR